MERQLPGKRDRILKLLTAIALLLPLAACDGNLGQAPSSPTPAASPAVSASPSPGLEGSPSPTSVPSPPVSSPTPAEKGELAVYWVNNDGTDLSPSPLVLTESGLSGEQQLQQALARLLKGPANADVASAIPDGTQLNQVVIKPDGVHVDISQAFTSGGGSVSMQARLGQLIYTASSLQPNVPVWIRVDGEPLTVLGGEGLEVAQPMTRQAFDEAFLREPEPQPTPSPTP
jgi:spore germination protein GerM